MRLEGQLPICLYVKKLRQQIFIPNHVLFTQHKMVLWLRNSLSEDDERLHVKKMVGTKMKWMTEVTWLSTVFDDKGCMDSSNMN
jgi:hypothetical protein